MNVHRYHTVTPLRHLLPQPSLVWGISLSKQVLVSVLIVRFWVNGQAALRCIWPPSFRPLVKWLAAHHLLEGKYGVVCIVSCIVELAGKDSQIRTHVLQ